MIKCAHCGKEYETRYGNFYTDPRAKGWMNNCFDCIDGARKRWEGEDESSDSRE